MAEISSSLGITIVGIMVVFAIGIAYVLLTKHDEPKQAVVIEEQAESKTILKTYYKHGFSIKYGSYVTA